ncbi:MAG: host attachment protein [Phaeovulum sp.]|uniref:host attachment protein n=1 Tax=Phaeovulum sp. TaxID=2934796 RepID=UPI00272FE8D7|nr:host attachment protein [Phaeovulum sp.]MDP2063781.1 host attachment protein [Phaeovulum sp.]MDP3862242.1 host attachment protein [Phaeovulum sp.]
MKRDTFWALVMNSTRARILRGVRKGGHQGAPELVLRAPHRALRGILSGVPRDAAPPPGPGRCPALQCTSDPVREDATAFVEEVVVLLETHRKAGDFDRLAIFASQEVLGTLDKHLTAGLKAVTSSEVARDLMQESEPDLMRSVRGQLHEN